MSVTERLDAFQQRHTWAGLPIAVLYKFVDDQGNYLAVLITYYGFLSLFPLLLLLTSILGFVLQDDPARQQRILDSTLSQFPVIGDTLGHPGGLRGSGLAVVVAVLGLVYGALGVAQAGQNAMNVAWAVPRNRRPNPIMVRVRSLLLLATVGVAILGTTVLSGLGSSANAFGADLRLLHQVLVTLLSVLLNAAVFVLAFRLATAQGLRKRDVVPGALAASVVWQLLQSFGTRYVGYVVKHAGATYGTFALVLGLIAWIYLGAVAVVLCTEVNVVRARHLYPRALLTPFTDDVDLTAADQKAYAGYAAAQRNKGFESVEVTFDHDGQNATARRRQRRK